MRLTIHKFAKLFYIWRVTNPFPSQFWSSNINSLSFFILHPLLSTCLYCSLSVIADNYVLRKVFVDASCSNEMQSTVGKVFLRLPNFRQLISILVSNGRTPLGVVRYHETHNVLIRHRLLAGRLAAGQRKYVVQCQDSSSALASRWPPEWGHVLDLAYGYTCRGIEQCWSYRW